MLRHRSTYPGATQDRVLLLHPQSMQLRRHHHIVRAFAPATDGSRRLGTHRRPRPRKRGGPHRNAHGGSFVRDDKRCLSLRGHNGSHRRTGRGLGWRPYPDSPPPLQPPAESVSVGIPKLGAAILSISVLLLPNFRCPPLCGLKNGDSMHEVAPPYLPPLPTPPPTSPPYLPPLPSPPYLPPLPSARFARQTARFARRGGQPPHPP